jgi:subtilisin family serine protease
MVRAVPDGDEHDKDIALAIRYAVDNGAKIISMSLVKIFPPEKRWVDDAYRYAESKGVLLVQAAGNAHKKCR